VDERARVREALAALVGAGGWPGVDRLRTTNVLLDLCGSDARPSVALLVTHAEVAAELLAVAHEQPWEARRQHAIDGLRQRGLDAVDARWVVESWAVALGVIDAHAITRVRTTAAPPPPLSLPASRPPAGPARTWGRRTTGGPARWRGGTPVTALPRWSRVDRIAGAIAAMMFLTVTIAAWRGIGSTAEERRIGRALPTANGAVAAAFDAAIVQVAAPERDRIEGSTMQPLSGVAAPAVIETAEETARPITDARFAPPLLVRGIGGRYLVWRALVSVSGDEGCERLDRAVDWQRPSDEVVTHVPGHTTFSFSARRVLRGELGWDGSFVVAPVTAAMDGGSYRVTMRGTFGDDGFQAESETVSRVLLGWRQWQTCRLVTTMRGVRHVEGPAR